MTKYKLILFLNAVLFFLPTSCITSDQPKDNPEKSHILPSDPKNPENPAYRNETVNAAVGEISLKEFMERIKLFPDIVYSKDDDEKSREKSAEYNESIIDFINSNQQVVYDLMRSNKIDPNIATVFIINAYINIHPTDFQDFRTYECGEITNGKCLLCGFMLYKRDPKEEFIYRFYKINEEEKIFSWKNGRGAHNDSFWLWNIKNTEGRFAIKLYRREEKLKDDLRKYELVADTLTVMPKKNILILKGGDYPEKKYLMKNTTLIPAASR